MVGRCSLIILIFVLSIVPQALWAEELSGKLERVDLDTVTLVNLDNKKVIVRIDADNRFKAAPFLGKTVSVDVKTDQGECRAVRFRSPK